MKPLTDRLVKGSGAQGLSLIARTAEQLLLIPLFLSTWSVSLYGEWLILATIPVYLSLSDFGFVTAGSNELARRGRNGITSEVKSFYYDYLSVCLLWSLLILIAIVVGAMVVPFKEIFQFSEMKGETPKFVFIIMMCEAICSQNTMTLVAGMRVTRGFHIGVFIIAIAAICKLFLAFFGLFVFDANPLTVSLIFLFVQIAAFGMLAIALSKRGMQPRWRIFTRPTNRMWPLVKVGVEYMLFPVSQAIVMQGMIILVGSKLGVVAAVVYSTHRTLTRLTSKIVHLAVAPVLAEFGLIDVIQDKRTARTLLVKSASITLWMSILMSCGLMVIGKPLFEAWTKGEVGFSFALFSLLVLVTLFEGVWRISATLRLGTNLHQELARGYFIISMLGVGISFILLAKFGVLGAGVGLLLIEFAMVFWVIYSNQKLIGLNIYQYSIKILIPPYKEASRFFQVVFEKLGKQS